MAAMGRERSGVQKGTDMAEEGGAEARRTEETGHGGEGKGQRLGVPRKQGMAEEDSRRGRGGGMPYGRRFPRKTNRTATTAK